MTSLQKEKQKNQSQLKPLAERIRPQKLEEIIGQDHLLGENDSLTLISKSQLLPSLILHGPAGVGKTSIAKILAQNSNEKKNDFVIISAINSDTKEIKGIFEKAQKRLEQGVKTILMVDEIHYFNKTRQDLFLPAIESGQIILIGTTTENPSFHLNSALLSRCKVLTLKTLDEAALTKIISRVEEFLGKKLPLNNEAKQELIALSCGDARYLINACEEISHVKSEENLDKDQLLNLISKRSAEFDKKGDAHYNLISAFHKALRGSDVDAALYYLARMMVAKQDPYYILRRMAKFATEDVGLADPQALLQVMAAKENFDFLGSPEGDFALSYAAIYLATAPKSNAAYLAHYAMVEKAESSTNLMPPKHILNAPTKLMKEQGFGKGYIYDHDMPNCFSGQEYFPQELLKNGKRPKFYKPNERGFEREVKKRLEYWQGLRNKINKT